MKLNNVTVLIADGKPNIKNVCYKIDEIELPLSTVDISDGVDNSKLGEAKLMKENGKVIAYIDLDLQLHPRIANRLFPQVTGVMSKSGGVLINGVTLSSKNSDERIETIGAQCSIGVKVL